jgi:hypothetical protein
MATEFRYLRNNHLLSSVFPGKNYRFVYSDLNDICLVNSRQVASRVTYGKTLGKCQIRYLAFQIRY